MKAAQAIGAKSGQSETLPGKPKWVKPPEYTPLNPIGQLSVYTDPRPPSANGVETGHDPTVRIGELAN